MKIKEKREQAAEWLERIFLAVFALLVAYTFLKTTSFPVPWKLLIQQTDSEKNRLWAKIVLEAPYHLLGWLVVLRYAIQKKYRWGRTALAVVLLYAGRYLWQSSGYSRVLLFFLLIVGMNGISFRKVIKVYFSVVSTLLLLAVVCSLTGLIENYTYMLDRGTRISFGIVYPTNFAAYVLFQVLCWWYLRREKLTYAEAAVTAGLAGFVKVFCDARCSTLLLLVTAAAMVWNRFRYQRSEKKQKEYEMCSVFAALMTLAYPLIACCMVGLTVCYDNSKAWMATLNNLFSARLDLGKKAIDVYGMRPWGQYIKLFNNAEGKDTSFYFYIDSSYVQLAVMYGLVLLGLVLLAFLLISCRAWSQKEWIFLWILAVAAVHGVMEQHLVELPYCPFILALLADTAGNHGVGINEIIWVKRWRKKGQS